MSLIVRRAEARDIPAILDLLVQVDMVHHNGRPDLFKGPATKYSAAELEKILADEETPVFVCVDPSDRVEVREMQKKLKELGYYKGSADGDFGPATEKAVKAFQKANGLTADGKAGQKRRYPSAQSPPQCPLRRESHPVLSPAHISSASAWKK